MTAAFTDSIRVTSLLLFFEQPLTTGMPKRLYRKISPFFPEQLFWILLDLLMVFFPMLPVATFPASSTLKMSVFKFQIITSVQCESGIILESCLKS